MHLTVHVQNMPLGWLSTPISQIHMVTERERVQDEMGSEDLQQRQSPETGIIQSQPILEGSTLSISPEKASDELQQRQSPDTGVHASQSNQEGNTHSMITEKVSDNLQQIQSPDSRDHTSQSNQEKSSLSKIPEELSDNLQQRQNPDNGVLTSQCNQEGITLSTTPEKVSDNLQQSQRPNTEFNAIQLEQEGSTPSIIPEKASDDGYNWRRYGQKVFKGNKFFQSYYKCTHPNCPAKKQVKRSHDGRTMDIIYFGNHEHPKPQPSSELAVGFFLPIQAKRTDEPALAIAEDKSSDAHDQASHCIEPIETPQLSTDAASGDVGEVALSRSNRTRDGVDTVGNPDLKRQKRDIFYGEETLVDKRNGEPRNIVQTRSEVDIVNDGYRWRKYGQKFVKGNPNPRSYYRCSSAGCPAKKRVERASDDPKMVFTTYEGQHDHDMPPARTVTPNTAGGNTKTTPLNGESRSKPEENDAVGLDVVVHISAN